MIGFLGVLSELANQDILDTVTYICGTSGSTWCMTSLYNHDNWSASMGEMERNICEKLSKHEWDCTKSWEKFEQIMRQDTASLTAFWAYVVIQMMTKDINEMKLSDHRTSCETGTNPYPIYAAVEKENVDNGIPHKPGTWFEFTPHKAGFPAYRHFVDTKLLGSQFEEGKPVKITPERELCFLQGICGSALASTEEMWDIIKGHFNNTLSEAKCTTSNEDKDIGSLKCKKCKDLHCLISEDHQSTDFHHKEELLLALTPFLDDTKLKENKKEIEDSMETYKNISNWFSWGLDCCKMVSQLFISLVKWEWGKYFHSDDNHSDSELCEMWTMTHSFLVSLARWEWGKTHNFFYNPNDSGSANNDMLNKEYIYLIDAGLEINTAYPLMLRPNRKVDLILSFDFSSGDPFETLTKAREYCTINDILFPKIGIQDEGNKENIPSQNCYIFEDNDKDVPVVMHFPLFNSRNCGDNLQQWRDRYCTSKYSYTDLDVQDLLRVSKENVKFSMNQILEMLQQLRKHG
ncbi:cytosolic phospholipase A2 gamma-like [Pelobates fuscus]|uniref:cytosolic phospholipase A2 gamma-like n=1 Tax=Pelobates fuscus TaxID=191477 RepID=UPI002FE4AEC8